MVTVEHEPDGRIDKDDYQPIIEAVERITKGRERVRCGKT